MENACQAIHRNAFPYFTDLSVLNSVFVEDLGVQPGFMIQYNTMQATCNTTLVHYLGLAGKRPIRIKSPLQ